MWPCYMLCGRPLRCRSNSRASSIASEGPPPLIMLNPATREASAPISSRLCSIDKPPRLLFAQPRVTIEMFADLAQVCNLLLEIIGHLGALDREYAEHDMQAHRAA